MTFESLTLTPFCLEKSSVRKGIFNVLATFSARCMLNSGKICKNNDHTCLFHCINTCRVPRTMFEHEAGSNSFLGTRQMLMHEKNMCDPYILMLFFNQFHTSHRERSGSVV